MKTAVIFFEVPEEVKYFLVDGDIIHLDGVYINDCEADQGNVDELTNVMFDPGDGTYRVEPVDKSELVAAIRGGSELIECGFYM